MQGDVSAQEQMTNGCDNAQDAFHLRCLRYPATFNVPRSSTEGFKFDWAYQVERPNNIFLGEKLNSKLRKLIAKLYKLYFSSKLHG